MHTLATSSDLQETCWPRDLPTEPRASPSQEETPEREINYSFESEAEENELCLRWLLSWPLSKV